MCFYFLHLKLKIQICLGPQNDECDRWHESESPAPENPNPGQHRRWISTREVGGRTCAKRVLDSCRPSSRRALQIRAHMR